MNVLPLNIDKIEALEQELANSKPIPVMNTECATTINGNYYYINAKKKGAIRVNRKILDDFHLQLEIMLNRHNKLYCICNLSLRITHQKDDKGLMSKVINRIRYQLTKNSISKDFAYLWVREIKDDNRHYHLSLVIPDSTTHEIAYITNIARTQWNKENRLLTNQVRSSYLITPKRYEYRIQSGSNGMRDFIYHNSYLAKKYTKPAISHVKTHGLSKIKPE